MSRKDILIDLNGIPARKCSKCGVVKGLKEGFNRSRGQFFGFFSQCKQCTSADKKARGYRQADLRKHFDITLEEYNKISELQQDVCAICRRKCLSGNNLAVDHDHETDVIRGLLCDKCNGALGMLEENEDIIWNMLEYLKKHKWSKIA